MQSITKAPRGQSPCIALERRSCLVTASENLKSNCSTSATSRLITGELVLQAQNDAGAKAEIALAVMRPVREFGH